MTKKSASLTGIESAWQGASSAIVYVVKKKDSTSLMEPPFVQAHQCSPAVGSAQRIIYNHALLSSRKRDKASARGLLLASSRYVYRSH